MSWLESLIQWLIIGKDSKSPIECTCGQHDKCTKNLYTTRSGKIYIKKEEHFKCGKVQDIIKHMKEFWEKKYNKYGKR